MTILAGIKPALMTTKALFCLLFLVSFSFAVYAQKITTGAFNDWGYGPTSVYGNFRLNTIKDRFYFKIETGAKGLVKVKRINPSGVTVKTTLLHFSKDTLTALEELNQWDDIYEYMKFTVSGKGELKVTDLYEGCSDFLPCKYAIYSYSGELLTAIQYYSFDNRLMDNRDGVAVIRYHRYSDAIRFGEPEDKSYLDKNGLPVISKAQGCHMVKYEFDEHSNKVLESYLGINHEPVTVQKKQNSKTRYYYNDNSELLKMVYYNQNDQVAPNISGVAITKGVYDKGYLVELSGFDAAGLPARTVASFDSVSIVKSEYDSRGNLVKEAYFDEQGNPVSNFSGVHITLNTWSKENMLVNVCSFDDFEKPSVDIDGIQATRYVRDKFGRNIQKSTYGIHGEPVLNHIDEVYMLKYQYDVYGRQINVSYWMDSLTPMPRWSGNYQQVTWYDAEGQISEYASLDKDGHPFKDKDGSSSVKLINGPDGRLVERRYLLDGEPVLTIRGVTQHYSTIRYGHDENGQLNELTFFGTDAKPINATIYLDQSFPAQRIVFRYKGTRIVEQDFYETGSAIPSRTIDCLNHDCIGSSGINIKRKNPY